MKKYIPCAAPLVLAFVLLVPAITFAAAYNDVQLGTDSTFNVGGVSLDVHSSSSVVESATVSGSNLVLALLPGSAITVKASGGNVISQAGGDSYVVINECDANASLLQLSDPSTGAAATVTVTVSTTAFCSGSAGNSGSSASSGGSSGGGGGSVVPVVATSITPTATTVPITTPTTTTIVPATSGLTATQIQSILNVLASFNADSSVIASVRAALSNSPTPISGGAYSFARDLAFGVIGVDVQALQQYLNAHGYIIAVSGSGSLNNETTKFGALTQAALIKFQKASGITPAVGYFGAKTRAYIATHP